MAWWCEIFPSFPRSKKENQRRPPLANSVCFRRHKEKKRPDWGLLSRSDRQFAFHRLQPFLPFSVIVTASRARSPLPRVRQPAKVREIPPDLSIDPSIRTVCSPVQSRVGRAHAPVRPRLTWAGAAIAFACLKDSDCLCCVGTRQLFVEIPVEWIVIEHLGRILAFPYV